MSGEEGEVPEDEADPKQGVGTTGTRWRWKGLSTLVALFLVFYYPMFLLGIFAGYLQTPEGTVMGVLTFAWLVGIGYSVGTDILKDVQEIRGGL